jgi:predicted amidophosphoribosyltransferase
MTDCPRCGCERTNDEQFCLYCQWDFTQGWKVCDVCGVTIKYQIDGCATCTNNKDNLIDMSANGF